LLTAFLVAFFVVNDGSYQDLQSMQQSLSQHQIKNQEIASEVARLRYEAESLQNNDRYLEKVVRRQLLLARPNEVVVLFDD
jgi:cell division protein FtsB